MMIDKKMGELFMNQNFYEGIKSILTTARNKVYQTTNFAMELRLVQILLYLNTLEQRMMRKQELLLIRQSGLHFR